MKTLLHEGGRHLRPFEEAVGVLNKIEDGGGFLLVSVSKTTVNLPIKMGEVLRPLLGQRMGILRTDDPRRPYLCRTLDGKDRSSTRVSLAHSLGVEDSK